MNIKMKRIYSEWEPDDGIRILVDRLWARGIKKEHAKIDHWPKALTPSNELRKWYSHDVEHWGEFQRRYKTEIAAQPEQWRVLQQLIQEGTVTLLTASKHNDLNQVVVLKALLEETEE